MRRGAPLPALLPALLCIGSAACARPTPPAPAGPEQLVPRPAVSPVAEHPVAEHPPPGVSLASPAVPFAVWADHDGEVEPGQPRPLTFTMAPGPTVTAVSTTVRGLDGVVVRGVLRREHGRPARGQRLRHRVSVEAAPGVAGFALIDIAWQEPGGGGSTTVGVEVRARGASRRLHRLGRVVRDERGAPLEVMPAQMRPSQGP